MGFLFTAAWQITAVVIAAKFELRVDASIGVLVLVGMVVALSVVLFDWHMIHAHVSGGASRKMWAARILFTLCMVLLVSEVAATAIFSKDVQAQTSTSNSAGEKRQADKRREIQSKIDQEVSSWRRLNGNIGTAQQRLTTAKNDRDTEAGGFGDADAGKGDLWHLADQKVKLYEGELAAAKKAVTDGSAAHEQVMQQLTAELAAVPRSEVVIPFEELGPGQQEAALWAYMLAHPSALFMKRIPLFVIMVCLDTFALLIGMAVSKRTRESHRTWGEEQLEWATAARFVRAKILEEAKGVIGRLVRDGMRGAAEQRAVRERWQRAMKTSRAYASDAQLYEEEMADLGFEVDWSTDYSYLNVLNRGAPGNAVPIRQPGRMPPTPPAPRRPAEARQAGESQQHTEAEGRQPGEAEGLQHTGAEQAVIDLREPLEPPTAPIPVQALFAEPRVAGADGGLQAAGVPSTPGAVAGDRGRAEPVDEARGQFTLPGPRTRTSKLENDPADQTEGDVAAFLDQTYTTGGPMIRSSQPLAAVTGARSQRATLLLGADPAGRQYVVKIFALSGPRADAATKRDLTRDASNAKRMTDVTGRLSSTGQARSRFLAPGSFGTKMVNGTTIPYLVTPFYPSGSILQYLELKKSHQLTLDWCLTVSEQMFRACAELAENKIVGCDAKLANFVFSPGEFSPELTPAADNVIRAAGNGPADSFEPIIRMIDLSMVYLQEGDVDPGTRGTRGTEWWSSPRALTGQADGRPYPLTSLDDAYTVAVNSMYLLTEHQLPYRSGSRVALETLGGSDQRAQHVLRKLSQTYAVLADDTSTGPSADHLLGAGLAWLRDRRVPETEACAAAADEVAALRQELPVTVRQKPFRKLQFVMWGDQ